MAVNRDYMDPEDFADLVGDVNDVDEPRYKRAITASSRLIDYWCDPEFTRHFWKTDTVEARSFTAFNRYLVLPGFIADDTSLAVHTDDNGDGTFETVWAAGDYKALPGSRPAGEAISRIVAVGGKRFPVSGFRESIQITAVWGWDAVPDLVEQACQTLAVALYKSKDFTGGDVGFQQLEHQAGWSVYQLAQMMISKFQLDPKSVIGAKS